MSENIKVTQIDAGRIGNAINGVFKLQDNYTAERTDERGNKSTGSGSTPEEAVKNTY